MRIFSFLVLVAIALAADPWIWPLPKSYSHGSKSMKLDSAEFKFLGQDNVDLKDAFSRYYNIMFEKKVTVSGLAINAVTVVVDNLTAKLELGADESYTLTIPDDGSRIRIVANTIYGAYRALETLSQLVFFDYETKSYIIKDCPWKITDEPRFSHRGILLDTSRHFESVQVIKTLLDSMSFAKLNVFHWHITDTQSQPSYNSYYPNFWKGAYSAYEKYTLEDIAEVVEYARKRGIRVVPELDVPGHEASWCDGVPEVCPSMTCREPLDPSSKVTWDLIDKVFLEWTGGKADAGLFYDEFYHLGGDEVDYKCWKETNHIAQWMKDTNRTTETTYEYFVKRSFENLLKYKRNGIFWEEVWNHFGTALPKESIIETWMNKKTMVSVVDAGYRVIISDPQIYLDHLDKKWTDLYNDEPMEFHPDASKEKFVLGGEACMWSETVDVSDLFNTVWPRAGAFAERYWSPREVTSVENAKPRFMNFRCMLNRRGIPAAPALNSKARAAPNGPGSCYAQ